MSSGRVNIGVVQETQTVTLAVVSVHPDDDLPVCLSSGTNEFWFTRGQAREVGELLVRASGYVQ